MISDSSENSMQAVEAEQPKAKRKGRKKTKATKKQATAKKAAGKPKADRSNKKAVVIELLKHSNGCTSPIMCSPVHAALAQ